MSYTQPFLKWAGNKYRILNQILPYIGTPDFYIEPFVGSGSVFLNVPAREAILGDINPDLINLYKFIQEEGQTFLNYAAKFFTFLTGTLKKYGELRQRYNQSPNIRERAALLVYLNKHCYRGLMKYSRQQKFDQSFGNYKSAKFPMNKMIDFQNKLAKTKTTFLNLDFNKIFSYAKAGSLKGRAKSRTNIGKSIR